MSRESIVYLLDAEDRATKKFRKTQEAIESNVKHVKELGGQGKQSMDLLASAAGALGEGPLASMAGQLSSLTDQLTNFTEQAAEAGQASMSMKVGVAAATAAVSGFIGYEIGKHLWGLQQQIDEVNRGFSVMGDRASDLATMKGFQLGGEASSIQLIQDASERQAALEQFKQRMIQEVEGTRRSLASQQAEIDSRERSWWSTVSADYAKQTEMLRHNMEGNRQLLEVYKSQRDAMIQQTSAQAQKLAMQKAEQAAIAKSDAVLERLRNERDLAMAKTDQDRLRIMLKQQGVQQNMMELAVGLSMQTQKANEDRIAKEKEIARIAKDKESAQRAREAEKRSSLQQIINAEKSQLTDLKAKLKALNQNPGERAGKLDAGGSQRLLTGRAEGKFGQTLADSRAQQLNQIQLESQKLLEQMKAVMKSIDRKTITIKTIGA